MKSIPVVCVSLLLSALLPSAGSASPLHVTAPATRVTLPESLIVSKHETTGSAPSLSQSFQKHFSLLQDSLDHNAPFHGLYAIGGASNRMLHNNPYGQSLHGQGYLGLQFQLFRRGYFQGRRKTKLGTTEALIDGYTLSRNMQAQQLDDALYHSATMRNAVVTEFDQKIWVAQKRLTDLYRRRLRAGYATRQELAAQEEALEDAREDLNLHKGLNASVIPRKTAYIVDHIDRVRLSPLDQLYKTGLKHSNIEKMRKLFTQEAELTTPHWSDYVNVAVYARHDFGYLNGNDIGVTVAVPLDGNLNAGNIVSQRAQLQSVQLAEDKLRFREKLKSLIEQFRYAQNVAKQRLNHYMTMIALAKGERSEARHVVSTLQDTPRKNLQQMSVSLLRQQRDIHTARFDAYNLLLELEAMVRPSKQAWYSIP